MARRLLLLNFLMNYRVVIIFLIFWIHLFIIIIIPILILIFRFIERYFIKVKLIVFGTFIFLKIPIIIVIIHVVTIIYLSIFFRGFLFILVSSHILAVYVFNFSCHISSFIMITVTTAKFHSIDQTWVFLWIKTIWVILVSSNACIVILASDCGIRGEMISTAELSRLKHEQSSKCILILVFLLMAFILIWFTKEANIVNKRW